MNKSTRYLLCFAITITLISLGINLLNVPPIYILSAKTFFSLIVFYILWLILHNQNKRRDKYKKQLDKMESLLIKKDRQKKQYEN